MKKFAISLAVIAIATMAIVSESSAQCTGRSAAPNAPFVSRHWPCSNSRAFSQGHTRVNCGCGRHAARIHEWNKFMGQQTPWHGNYNYWRFNAPTALVVPPTAAFQTSYAWGVGQTRSIPINHQFGSINPGGGAGSGSFGQSPYLPSSTEQSGVYPVRAPWSHQ